MGITLMNSHAEMAEQELPIAEIMSKPLGSDGVAAAALKEFGGTLDHNSNRIFAHRADLSTPR